MRKAPDDGRFGADDVRDASGLTYRELHYAITRGYLTTLTPTRGSGTVFRFALEDLRRARVFGAARRAGLEAPAAAHVASVALSGSRRVELAPGVTLLVDEQVLRPR